MGDRREARSRDGTPTREEMGEVKKRIWAAVEAGQITEAQAKERWEGYLKQVRAGRSPLRHDGAGLDDKKAAAIKKLLSEKGFSDTQTGQAMGALARIVPEMKSEGDTYEMDERLHAWLSGEAGLDADQIDLLEEVAKRICIGSRRGARGRVPTREEMGEVKKKIWDAVKAGQITEEQAKKRWEAYLKWVRAGQDKARGDKTGPSREELEAVGKKIKAAIAAGEITEEQGRARWEAYLERLKK